MKSTPPPYALPLADLMQQAGIADLDELSQISGLSSWQLARIQYGLLSKMSVENLIKLATALRLSPEKVLAQLCPDSGYSPTDTEPNIDDRSAEIERLQLEYQRLQQKFDQQRETLVQEFQHQAITILESWLLQWPTAAAAAHQNPQFPAIKLLPLMKPLANLLQQWEIEAIAAVGESVSYNPQWHQLMDGTVEAGSTVIVRYVGYRQGKKLLYRAKVSQPENLHPPVSPSQPENVPHSSLQ
jgi:molecular chaperone GrpE (heat shock protein)